MSARPPPRGGGAKALPCAQASYCEGNRRPKPSFSVCRNFLCKSKFSVLSITYAPTVTDCMIICAGHREPGPISEKPEKRSSTEYPRGFLKAATGLAVALVGTLAGLLAGTLAASLWRRAASPHPPPNLAERSAVCVFRRVLSSFIGEEGRPLSRSDDEGKEGRCQESSHGGCALSEAHVVPCGMECAQ